MEPQKEPKADVGRKELNVDNCLSYASADEIKFTPENAPFHLSNLFRQLQAVFEDGEFHLDRLDNVAHW